MTLDQAIEMVVHNNLTLLGAQVRDPDGAGRRADGQPPAEPDLLR